MTPKMTVNELFSAAVEPVSKFGKTIELNPTAESTPLKHPQGKHSNTLPPSAR